MKIRGSALVPAFVVFLLAASGCFSSGEYISRSNRDWRIDSPPPAEEELYRVFLIGDTGAIAEDSTFGRRTFRLLNRHLMSSGDQSAVVFLGDNVYCCGLPDSATARRAKAESILDAQLATIQGFDGRVIFIPGNHDWNNSRPGGVESVRRQEKYLESRAGRGNIFLPDYAFPGPVEVELTDHITLVAVDTEWWLSNHYKPMGDTGEYDLEEDEDFLLELEDLLMNDLDDDDVLVVGHHPMFSNGIHGGRVKPKAHLFPLTLEYERAYVPLPVIGTIAALYLRYFGGSRQDIPHPRYRALRDAFVRIFSGHERLIYASGHEHSLQHFRIGNAHLHQDYIVSGAGARPTYVTGGGRASFTANPEGYATLHYYHDQSVWLSFWDTLSQADSSRLIFRKKLKKGRTILEKSDLPVLSSSAPDYSDSIAVTSINDAYLASPLKEFFLGSHHRKLWAETVSAPYLDMARDGGGLSPVKRGGGMQTRSLRLAGGDGKEYVLRSLDKDPSGTVPDVLQGTIATDIVQDQIASINPYAAFILPRLADAAGVYHTLPRLVYVPDDPRLGPFRDFFSNRLMMFEDRPDDDESDRANYGYTDDVESASTMYRKITEDNDDRVDQEAFARARLFDMWLADWDRHRDQWRWASFDDPDGKGKLFKPIPRDRDWAMNKMNGVFPTLASQFDPKFQDFSESYGYLKGLTLNGHEQDRRLLNRLTRTQWKNIARELQDRLTDDVIESAAESWPESIFQLAGAETILFLKVRREGLVEIAEAYYELLAGVVDFVGSDKHERIEIVVNEDSVSMSVQKTSKEGDILRPLYRRTFFERETEELRVFGLDGDDRFLVEGSKSEIDIILVGGPGDDLIENNSDTRVTYFDTASNEWSDFTRVNAVVEPDPKVNNYNPLDYNHDARLPQIFFGHNSADGVFVGGGLLFIKHGFRKNPFAVSHRIVGNIAGRTGAFNIDYEGTFTDVSNVWDGIVHTYLSSPGTIRNFFGFGNATEREVDSRRFYESRLTRFGVESRLRADIDGGLHASFGPSLTVTSVREDEDRFLANAEDVSGDIFETQYLVGMSASVGVENVESNPVPYRGFKWNNSVDARAGISAESDNLFVRLSTDFVLYLSPVRNRLTLALRSGASHIYGDFPYYESSSLGGHNNLRGYLRDRFNGRTSFFQNAEGRIRLFNYSTYLATGRFGILGFVDNGRVWYDSESSRDWHQGYGGGVWTNLLGAVTLSSWAGFSPEDTTVSFRFGFQY